MGARRIFLVAVVALILPGSAAEARVDSLRVLFVGNSLTETNNLPAVVASLAVERPTPRVPDDRVPRLLARGPLGAG